MPEETKPVAFERTFASEVLPHYRISDGSDLLAYKVSKAVWDAALERAAALMREMNHPAFADAILTLKGSR